MPPTLDPTPLDDAPPSRLRSALVIAHPGHELRVHGWLERERPLVFVLTDGSGHTGRGRLASTTEVLEGTGARPGSIYGRLSDRAIYRALLDRDAATFLTLAEELSEALDRPEIEVVVGDAAEGFNPGHDACRLVLNAALARLAARGRVPRSYEFPLDSAPDSQARNTAPAGTLRLELDEPALARKLAASHGYPEMAYEVEKALAAHGSAAFRIETLTPVEYGFDIGSRFPHPPYYEVYGEGQVAKGIYSEVLRYRDHFEPMIAALARFAAFADHPGPEGAPSA